MAHRSALSPTLSRALPAGPPIAGARPDGPAPDGPAADASGLPDTAPDTVPDITPGTLPGTARGTAQDARGPASPPPVTRLPEGWSGGGRREGLRGRLRAFALPALAALPLLAGLLAAVLPSGPTPWVGLSLGCLALGVLLVRHSAESRRLADANAALYRLIEAQADSAWERSESEERHRSLAEAFGDIVLHRDRSGRVTFASGALERLFGFAPGALIGGRFEPDVVESAPVAGQAGARALRLATRHGPRWFHWLDLPAREGGVTSVARDITAHKQAEAVLEAARARAEDASRAKTRFIATVSHEMRTPLNGILGMAHLLRETELTPEQASYVEAVHVSGRALLSLIEDLLDLRLIEAGRMMLRPGPTDLRRLAESVCELLGPRAHDKRVALSAFVDPALPLVVADAGRLRQVLVNLLGNAVKFTERGGVCLRLLHGGTGADGRVRLRVEVLDSGPGLTREARRRIFREFEQGDATTTRRHGGAGLGLSISQALVRMMDGQIEAGRRPGGGAAFRFTLDLAAVPGEAGSPRAALAGRRVLLCVRDTLERAALGDAIEAAGGKAEGVGSLSHARRRLTQGGIDSLMLDPDLCRRLPPPAALRALRAGLPPVPAAIPAAILVRPEERGRLGDWMDGFEAYLLRPFRQVSLERLLIGEARSEPLASAHPLPAAPAGPRGSERGGERGVERGGARILLAEDNPVNALLVATVLGKAGHAVHHAEDGRKALEAWRRAGGRGFDLVLLDLHMPELDGLSTLRAIRAEELAGGLPRTPVHVLSADEQAQMRAACAREGADGFLEKPVEPARLLALAAASRPAKAA